MKEFTFKTRFGLGENIVGFDPFNKRLTEFVITKISFNLTCNELSVWYHGNGGTFFKESDCFRNKQEFLDNLGL